MLEGTAGRSGGLHGMAFGGHLKCTIDVCIQGCNDLSKIWSFPCFSVRALPFDETTVKGASVFLLRDRCGRIPHLLAQVTCHV